MSERLNQPNKSQTDEHRDKYFSVQIKAWTNFDPMDKSLAKIAEAIEQGGGFVTLVEVLKVEDDLAGIGDEEARESFANILAARRLVRNLHELPETLQEALRQALKAAEEVTPKKTPSRAGGLRRTTSHELIISHKLIVVAHPSMKRRWGHDAGNLKWL